VHGWAGTGLLWTISGGVLASKTLAEIAQAEVRYRQRPI
jgi:hypothetical protein